MDAQPSPNALDDHDNASGVGRFILRLFLVVAGVILGAILALFIGLSTGWIQIC